MSFRTCPVIPNRHSHKAPSFPGRGNPARTRESSADGGIQRGRGAKWCPLSLDGRGLRGEGERLFIIIGRAAQFSATGGGNVRRKKGAHTFPPNQNQHPFPHLQQLIELLLLRIALLLTPSASAAPDSSTS